jgi:hypothetical protein
MGKLQDIAPLAADRVKIALAARQHMARPDLAPMVTVEGGPAICDTSRQLLASYGVTLWRTWKAATAAGLTVDRSTGVEVNGASEKALQAAWGWFVFPDSAPVRMVEMESPGVTVELHPAIAAGIRERAASKPKAKPEPVARLVTKQAAPAGKKLPKIGSKGWADMVQACQAPARLVTYGHENPCPLGPVDRMAWRLLCLPTGTEQEREEQRKRWDQMARDPRAKLATFTGEQEAAGQVELAKLVKRLDFLDAWKGSPAAVAELRAIADSMGANISDKTPARPMPMALAA